MRLMFLIYTLAIVAGLVSAIAIGALDR